MRFLLIVLGLSFLTYSCKKSETFPVEEDLVGAWQYDRIEANDSGTFDTTTYKIHFLNIKEVRIIVDAYRDTAKVSYYYVDYNFTLREKDSKIKFENKTEPEELPISPSIQSEIQVVANDNSLLTDANRTFITIGPFLDSLSGTTATTTFQRVE